MFARAFKTAAIAALVVVGTASASLAATWAFVDQPAKVKKFHTNASMTVNQVWVGQKVKVIGSWNNWVKIQIPGKDGWVKAHVLDYAPAWPVNPGYPGGASFCINGQNAQFCISGGY